MVIFPLVMLVYQRVNRAIFHIFQLEDHPRRTGKPRLQAFRSQWGETNGGGATRSSLANGILAIYVWPRYMANGIPNISLMANGIPYVHHLSLVFRIVERKVGGDMSKWCPNIVSDQSLRPWSPQDVYFFTMFLKYQWIGSREHRITGNHRFS